MTTTTDDKTRKLMETVEQGKQARAEIEERRQQEYRAQRLAYIASMPADSVWVVTCRSPGDEDDVGVFRSREEAEQAIVDYCTENWKHETPPRDLADVFDRFSGSHMHYTIRVTPIGEWAMAESWRQVESG